MYKLKCAWMVRALTVALGAFVFVLPAAADDVATTQGVLSWTTGQVTTPVQTPAEVAASLRANTRGGSQHVVVQFDEAVRAAQRSALSRAGVQLLSYVGDNAFFAVVDGNRIDPGAAARVGGVRCVLGIDPLWKQHPDIAFGTLPAWSVHVTKEQEVIAAAYVVFHRDVDAASAGAAMVRAHGGVVRSVVSSVNMLVVELPAENLGVLAAEDAVQWVEPPLPRLEPNNDDNRLRTGAEVVQDSPYNLDGSGVTVLVYDAGTAYASHPDFGGRATIRDTSGTHYHATHVAGTVGGDGASSSGTYRGMAPGVIIESYGYEQEGGLHEGFLYTDPGDIEEDYSEAILTYGAHISNNSIGTNTASNGFPCDWEGNYGATGVLIDTIVRGDGSNPLFASPFRIVWANGNERGSGRCGSTYHTTAPPACAKNHITVGALNSNDDSYTSFTSWGPTDDDRIKPDISAPGCQSNDDNGVTSCDNGGGYTTLCGTSMASPTVCGLGALILQDYRLQYPDDPDFRNSTLKTFLAHTAEDIYNTGPDYISGYGSVRVQPAIELMRSGNFFEASLTQGEIYAAVVIVAPEDDELKVTLAWDDVPGTPNVNPVLVNDLDLRVFDAQNNQYYPWTLGGLDDPDAPAVRNQPDHVNNIEQVVIDNPAPGAYRLEVFGYNVPQGPQPFSVTATPYLVNCSSQGTAALDRQKYACGGNATIRVVDCDLNVSDETIDTVEVHIASSSEPDGETVLLTETAPESAAFLNSIPLSTTDAEGVLLIAAGDSITLTYDDADDGSGSPAVVTDSAIVDCLPPVISNLQVSELNPRDATITFDTDEEATVAVYWGTACGNLSETTEVGGFRETHSVRIAGLQDDETYYFAVYARDEAGNESTDDNGGLCYSFTTPEVPDFFTEEFGGDFDLHYKRIVFQPNGSNDFYAGCVEDDVDEFPTDPAGGTTLSLSDDSSDQVSVGNGEQVMLYGESYGSFYVGSNGVITFDTGDSDYTESLEDHFDQVRISAFFDDLNPGSGGTVSWKQESDHVAVTWDEVPEYSNTGANSFQVQMFFNGKITITYLALTANDAVIGLSAGEGLSPDFYESDLGSMGVCRPTPPVANDGTVEGATGSPVEVVLDADDDGQPDPPALLTFTILSLPEHGLLFDPEGGAIISAPHVLTAGNIVTYVSDVYYVGLDSFTFMANDGGEAPDGGDSNVATVTVGISGGMGMVYSFPMNSDPGWSTEGQWAYGQPMGMGSHGGDPDAGHTGDHVYGYNLYGDYSNDMPRRYLTTTALDCGDARDIELRFWRWLGVQGAEFDHAGIQISNNGTDWVSIWEHTSEQWVIPAGWQQFTFDISDVADEQETVYIRWAMGPTDSMITYPGWNIDDVELWGIALAPGCPGDANCDGAVNWRDVDYFVAGMNNNSVAWRAMFLPDMASCPFSNLDVNSDDNVSWRDIDPFVELQNTDCP